MQCARGLELHWLDVYVREALDEVSGAGDSRNGDEGYGVHGVTGDVRGMNWREKSYASGDWGHASAELEGEAGSPGR